MTRVVLVRHGQTPWNEQGRLQGQTDVSLSPAGRREAERVGRVIDATIAPGAVVTSPLSRAAATTEIIVAAIDGTGTGTSPDTDTGTDTDTSPDTDIDNSIDDGSDTSPDIDGGVRVDTDSRWAERSFGSLEGNRAQAAFEARPELHPKSGAFEPGAAGDGESCRAVVDRVRAGWRSVRQKGDPLVVVTHETPLRIVTGLLDGRDPIEAIQHRSFSPGVAIVVDAVSGETDGEWRLLSTDECEEPPEKGS